MKLSSRLLRRIVIAGIFLAIFSLTGLGFRRAITPAPSCTDGIKNGEEEGIDCGLFACGNYCQPDLAPPQVISVKLLEADENDYDFVAEIKNPHQQFGASEVEYELVLFNGNEEEISRDDGIFYILPGQTKYFILTHLTTGKTVERIKFDILSATWQRIESLDGLNLIIRQDKYENLSGNNGSKLEAVIFNDSDFDFKVVDVDVVLFDSNSRIIAVNRSDIRTFLARTERGFLAIWPFQISGNVARFEIYPSANIFENSNFIKNYGSETEKFQQY